MMSIHALIGRYDIIEPDAAAHKHKADDAFYKLQRLHPYIERKYGEGGKAAEHERRWNGNAPHKRAVK